MITLIYFLHRENLLPYTQMGKFCLTNRHWLVNKSQSHTQHSDICIYIHFFNNETNYNSHIKRNTIKLLKCIFFVVQQPNSGLRHIIVEVSRSQAIRHTHTHTHTASRTLLKEWSARHNRGCYLHNIQQTQEMNLMPSVKFEPTDLCLRLHGKWDWP
jgi:hypothetical protein